MDRIIIHVDVDAFCASVEMRDNPALRGKPLIIGSLPTERGVVATCSYEARKYGIHSAMNIKEAYCLCPSGVYMHPDFDKYNNIKMLRLSKCVYGRYARSKAYRPYLLQKSYSEPRFSLTDFRRVGGQGDRYTIMVLGKETYLFFERNASPSADNNGRWFVEKRIAQPKTTKCVSR